MIHGLKVSVPDLLCVKKHLAGYLGGIVPVSLVITPQVVVSQKLVLRQGGRYRNARGNCEGDENQQEPVDEGGCDAKAQSKAWRFASLRRERGKGLWASTNKADSAEDESNAQRVPDPTQGEINVVDSVVSVLNEPDQIAVPV